MNEQPTSPQWVCRHCFFHLVNGDCTEPDTCAPGAKEACFDPMGMFGGMHVTPGMLSKHHECGREEGKEVDECECEQQSFSWSVCDGCWSGCGGSRYAVTGWTPTKERPTFSDDELSMILIALLERRMSLHEGHEHHAPLGSVIDRIYAYLGLDDDE